MTARSPSPAWVSRSRCSPGPHRTATASGGATTCRANGSGPVAGAQSGSGPGRGPDGDGGVRVTGGAPGVVRDGRRGTAQPAGTSADAGHSECRPSSSTST
ncbi:hypothetical protein GCM10009772_22540 [Pseudonocardia alni subsp. carboxydivorans]